MAATVTSAAGDMPSASLSLTRGLVSMTGQARLILVPEATAHGSSVAAVLASWAPTPLFATDRATLADIGSCYGPQPGTLYQVRSDQVFTYAIPARVDSPR